ncbi:MAG: flagellar hook capping FlgD N-terminal domain-containing protein [Phycisphaerales bacterium]
MSAINSVSSSAPPSATSAYSDLTSGEFLRVIFTELTNQDPLAPNETKDLLEQISSIRSIESDIELGDRLEDIAAQSTLASAGGLVGQFVYGRTQFNDEAAGVVVSVSVTKDGPVLNLDNGYSIPFKNIEEIIDPAVLRGAADTQSV